MSTPLNVSDPVWGTRKYLSREAKDSFCAPLKISRKASIKVMTCTVRVTGIMNSIIPMRIFRIPDMMCMLSLK